MPCGPEDTKLWLGDVTALSPASKGKKQKERPHPLPAEDSQLESAVTKKCMFAAPDHRCQGVEKTFKPTKLSSLGLQQPRHPQYSFFSKADEEHSIPT